MEKGTFIERVDAFDHVIWLPATTRKASEGLREIIEGKIKDECKTWDDVMRVLNTYGFEWILKVEHHGPQDYRIWSVSIKPHTWASARVKELLS